MRGSTAQLYEMMESNSVVKATVEYDWNHLFRAIYQFKNWDELDEISAFAIQDLYLEGVA